MLRMPWKLTCEWTTVVPEDNAMASFVNGQVAMSREHEGLKFRRGSPYRRRVLIWRGQWRLAEMRDDR